MADETCPCGGCGLLHPYLGVCGSSSEGRGIGVGLWEHPILSELDLTYAPNWAEHARAAAGVSSEYQLIWEEHELPGALDRHQDEGFQDPFRNARNPFMSEMPGWRLADEHARAQEVQASLDGLRGRSLDRRTLRSLGDELTDLESWPVSKAQARGLAFESFMEKLLLAHGCDVHRGKHRDGEQIDLIVHRPFRALVECRWTRRPVGAPDIAALVTKLTRDPPGHRVRHLHLDERLH